MFKYITSAISNIAALANRVRNGSKAAERIQSVARGYLTRNSLQSALVVYNKPAKAEIKEAPLTTVNPNKVRNTSAEVIQSIMRKQLAKKRLAELKKELKAKQLSAGKVISNAITKGAYINKKSKNDAHVNFAKNLISETKKAIKERELEKKVTTMQKVKNFFVNFPGNLKQFFVELHRKMVSMFSPSKESMKVKLFKDSGLDQIGDVFDNGNIAKQSRHIGRIKSQKRQELLSITRPLQKVKDLNDSGLNAISDDLMGTWKDAADKHDRRNAQKAKLSLFGDSNIEKISKHSVIADAMLSPTITAAAG